MRLWVTGIVLLGAVSQAQAGEYSKSYAVSGRPAVRVHVDDSQVRIVTSDTQQVEFNVSSEGSLDAFKINSQQDGNQVEISVLHRPGIHFGIGERHLITEVHMPRDADLQVEATDGAVTAAQLNGKIEIRSVDGAINTDALKGDVRLHSTDGAVTLTHFDGRADVSSTDGALRAEGRFDSLRLVTTDGSVVAKVADGSKMTSAWDIRTVDGSVNVSLPRDFRANINASTQDGHVRLDVPVTVQGEISKSKVRGTLNGGGPELTLKSTDGAIRISN